MSAALLGYRTIDCRAFTIQKQYVQLKYGTLKSFVKNSAAH